MKVNVRRGRMLSSFALGLSDKVINTIMNLL